MHLRTSLVGVAFMCIAATSAIWQGCQSSHSTNMPSNFKYPTSRVEPVIDTLWETEVADPYRWLEDDRASETSEWVPQWSSSVAAIYKELGIRLKNAQMTAGN